MYLDVTCSSVGPPGARWPLSVASAAIRPVENMGPCQLPGHAAQEEEKNVTNFSKCYKKTRWTDIVFYHDIHTIYTTKTNWWLSSSFPNWIIFVTFLSVSHDLLLNIDRHIPLLSLFILKEAHSPLSSDVAWDNWLLWTFCRKGHTSHLILNAVIQCEIRAVLCS